MDWLAAVVEDAIRQMAPVEQVEAGMVENDIVFRDVEVPDRVNPEPFEPFEQERVLSRFAPELVLALVADGRLSFPAPAWDLVVALAAIDRVVAIPGEDPVIAALGDDHVRAVRGILAGRPSQACRCAWCR